MKRSFLWWFHTVFIQRALKLLRSRGLFALDEGLIPENLGKDQGKKWERRSTCLAVDRENGTQYSSFQCLAWCGTKKISTTFLSTARVFLPYQVSWTLTINRKAWRGICICAHSVPKFKSTILIRYPVSFLPYIRNFSSSDELWKLGKWLYADTLQC